MPPPDNLHVDTVLSNLSLRYMNESMIADLVLPVVKVNKRSDKYVVYEKGQSYRLIDSSVGPKAQPNEVDWEVGTQNYSVNDYALAEYLPIESVDNADTPIEPRMDTNDFLNEWLALDREVRVAKIVFAAANYDTANKVDHSGDTEYQWNIDSGNPVEEVLASVEGCFVRANTLVFGQAAWQAFRTHKKVLDAVKSSNRHQAAGGGLATAPEVAALFEVDNVYVGRARYISSKRGQANVYARVWGKAMAALHIKKNPGVRSITFGVSFCEMMKQTQTMFDAKRGAKGAEYIKVGYNMDERLVAKDLGFLRYKVVK